jgi:ubiquitin-activating enzyme E1-like protein 2
MELDDDIDDSLYSRQRYVLGDSAMHCLARSRVLLYGLGGLGAEIAKNLALAGVKSITLQDSELCTYEDLGTQFFLRQTDVDAARNRAEASVNSVAELNPYVEIHTLTTELNAESSLEYLTQFDCVVLTECNLSTQLTVNKFCRQQLPTIKFISADVRGVFCWSFCDFGPEFEVVDPDGEEPRQVFIGDITKDRCGVVTTLENKLHGFQSGDVVMFKELQGMTALNGLQFTVNVLSPYKFSICDTTSEIFGEYTGGGIAIQVKVPHKLHFHCLSEQISRPSLVVADLCKLDAPSSLHVGFQALHEFVATFGQLPTLWSSKDAEQLIQLAESICTGLHMSVDSLDKERLRYLAYTCRGCLCALCAFLGGVVAQETLKALTGKFSPLNQWLYVDAVELLEGVTCSDLSSFQPRRSRYDALRMCIGEELCQKLAQLRLFMVGCGAIGCELLKNFALLGVSTSPEGQGQLTITDNDLIEKSNLNRQFLFRPHHIRMPKSTTAAQAVSQINPDMAIVADQHKVCQDTESRIYTDRFFTGLSVVVNALDNLEARRYMDSRCVTNQRPLLESGTMGAKGHVQVIVPHLTESYSSQRDPVDEDVPYCTLKSFPAVIEHCIEWARDKFETVFTQKPSLFNKFWSVHHSPQSVATTLEKGLTVDGAVTVSKMVHILPLTWSDCVRIGRIKFEKYFNHKAQQLLYAFPLDTRLKDGSLFWQSPKRPPTPLVFDVNNQLHLGFVTACARLYADICGVTYTQKDLIDDLILEFVQSLDVPQFHAKNKKIEIDESAKKPESADISADEVKLSAQRLVQANQQWFVNGSFKSMSPLIFEKDDDSNGHIDFIASAANLRASMYNIEIVDRLKIKKIAGRIVPAIATTTAAVAGLVSIELIKLTKKSPLECYKNAFLNLALPLFVFSEPAPVLKSKLSNGTEYTIWDRWEVHGSHSLTIQQFIKMLQEKHQLKPTLIVQGVKMIYVPIMPGHARRLPEPILKYLKVSDDKPYVDLVVSYQKANVTGTAATGDSDELEEMGPPVRYYFNS